MRSKDSKNSPTTCDALDRPSKSFYTPTMLVMAGALSTIVVVASLRVCTQIWYTSLPMDKFRWAVTAGIRNSHVDFALILVSMLIVLLLIGLSPRRSRLAWGLSVAFAAFTCLTVFLGWVNALALTYIRSPLTIQWIYYADFFGSYTSLKALSIVLTTNNLIAIVGALASWVSLYFFSLGLLRRMLRWRSRNWFISFAIIAIFVYFALAIHRDAFFRVPRRQTANPLITLVMTSIGVLRGDLLTVENPIEPEPMPPSTNDPTFLPQGLSDGQIQNVLLVVMESVGSRYVAGTGPEEAEIWTPNIASYLPHAIVMPNIYAPVPSSTKSFYSLITSRYPIFSFLAETEIFTNTPMPTLSRRLKDAGRRTAFIQSGDVEYQKVDKFLAGRGIDHVADVSSVPCDFHSLDNGWIPLEPDVDDRCTADAMIKWIDEDPKKAFFGIFWTHNSHYPYLPGLGNVKTSTGDQEKDRYLAGIQTSDAAIGRIVEHLRSQNRLEDTLIIITADHGEAFGEHDTRTHSSSVYEEQIHIPLLLINPKIAGARATTLGGIIDIGPTILHVLGLPQDPESDGRSLFDPNRSERIFMFSPHDPVMAAYREGKNKFIFDMSRGNSELFDLENDPDEFYNIADPESSGLGKRRLVGWIEQQRRRYQSIHSTRSSVTEPPERIR